MADIKEAFPLVADITSTFSPAPATLANGASSISAAIDNTADLYLDDLVQVNLTTALSGVSAAGAVNVYVAGSIDGATFDDSAGPNDKLIGVINANANDGDFQGTFGIATAFGGNLPPYYKIRLENETGAALTACTVKHRPVYATSI